MTTISKGSLQGLEMISVENESVRLSILPELGGKMISLVLKETGREFISLSGRPFKRAVYGTDYAEYDISGFDECFPGIAEGFYPEWPWQGSVIPDHGELFTLPWDVTIEKDALVTCVHGVRFPYRFVKTVTLQRNSVKINYELTNLSPCEFKYIWSAHPLFAVMPGTRILLPGNPHLRIDYSKHERFGKHLCQTSWPQAKQADDEVADVSIIRGPNEDAATKFFTTKLEEGWCALRHPERQGFLKMSFPVDKVPYVGMWMPRIHRRESQLRSKS